MDITAPVIVSVLLNAPHTLVEGLVGERCVRLHEQVEADHQYIHQCGVDAGQDEKVKPRLDTCHRLPHGGERHITPWVDKLTRSIRQLPVEGGELTGE